MSKEKLTTVHFKDIAPKEANDELKINMTSILSNISRIMKEKNVNQKELAFRIKSEESHVSRMLKSNYHKNGLTIKVLGRIALGLEVRLIDLIKQ